MSHLRLAVFGLSISSSWGNGHATTWRGLLRAMHARGHEIVFFERRQEWYEQNRDFATADWLQLIFYDSLADLGDWADFLCRVDAILIGSYVPEATVLAQRLRSAAPGLLVFYDIDTPVTVAQVEAGRCAYLDETTARLYDLYLSFTGGPFLDAFAAKARLAMARPLYCSADPDIHHPLPVPTDWDLSYLGTYSADRQPSVQALFIDVARALPDRRFAIAGAQYPDTIDWPANVERIEHAPPAEHAAFYARSRFTLNITRADMIAAGYSPSVRLFEAGACATPVISDEWRGLGEIFAVGRELLVARRTEDVIEFLARTTETARLTMGEAARRRVLAEHSAERRAEEFEACLLEAIAVTAQGGTSELRTESNVS